MNAHQRRKLRRVLPAAGDIVLFPTHHGTEEGVVVSSRHPHTWLRSVRNAHGHTDLKPAHLLVIKKRFEA